MTVQDILTIVNQEAPFEEQCGWDNSGLLVGHLDQEVNTVYLAVDATDEVIEHAIEARADVILTHHPLIFTKISRVAEDDFVGRRVLKLAENRIALISAHTNFDVHGMRTAIDQKLGLTEVQVLDEEGIGSVGVLENPMTLEELAAAVKERFGLSSVKVFGDGKYPLQKVAVCGGSGKSEIPVAIASGAEVLVTGDIDHHSGIDAVAQGLSIIDAGHYGLEHVFMEYMQEELNKATDGIQVLTEPKKEPFWVI